MKRPTTKQILAATLRKVAETYGISEDDVLHGKSNNAKEAMRMVCYIAHEDFYIIHKDLAEFVGKSVNNTSICVRSMKWMMQECSVIEDLKNTILGAVKYKLYYSDED